MSSLELASLFDCERAFVNVLGLETAYYRKGTGPTVVLLHGGAPGACTDVNWHRNFSPLVDEGFDVIAFDQPGSGYSGMPEDHSIEFRYRHAVEFLHALDVTRAYLVGNSIGGLLATLMYHRRASFRFSIEALVLAAPAPYFPVSDAIKRRSDEHRKRLTAVEPTYDSVLAVCRNTFFDEQKLTAQLVHDRLAMIERNRAGLQARRAAGIGFDRNQLETGKVLCRGLMIWGVNDRSVPVEVGIEALAWYPKTEFVFLPECGHWPQTEQAPRFNKLVIDFLSMLEREGSDGAQVSHTRA